MPDTPPTPLHPASLARPLVVRRATAALRGSIRVPGDKSISHRALMFAGLAVGDTRITGLLEGEDVLRTAAAMRALGAEIVRQADDSWHVTGRGIGRLLEPDDVLDMGNSGTAARLLTGLLASHPIVSVMTGDASLRRRPMRRVIDPLGLTGAVFTSRAGGRLPLCIAGCAEPRAISYRLPVASAQVKSAILLAGLNAAGETVVEEPVPTRDHSENMLRHFGAEVSVEADGSGRVIRLRGRPTLQGRDVLVPSDPSSAAFPMVAALLVSGSSIVIEAVGLNPLRTGLIATLIEMGADIVVRNRRVEGGEPVGDLVVNAGPLRGVDVPADRAPSMIDEYPVLAVAAAFATGTTRLRGLDELRVKESDRLASTVALLAGNGVQVTVEGDDMIVIGGGPDARIGGGRVETRMDHRLAMSAVVLGLAASEPVLVDDTGFIETSFPGFVALMNRIGAGIAEQVA
ncbi:3-phosphoshikimate 1-carboxyvinyltransferase [Lichenicola sp.]|uniref:3-phosphoshikimate 1-carboxyvinyltransferase n=1 Tax=Lichenicola sp. TaxID=2804529 RepID=UPI003B0062B0